MLIYPKFVQYTKFPDLFLDGYKLYAIYEINNRTLEHIHS